MSGLARDIQAKAYQFFVSQNRIVTLSVSFSSLENTDSQDILDYSLSNSFEDGYNVAKVIGRNGYKRSLEYWLTILEKLPAANRTLKPGDLIDVDCIESAWIPLRRITPYTYREHAPLLGMSLKYAKERGQPFQDIDLMKPEVIKAQANCIIILRAGPITITSPGIALKNGSIGSKIRVLNRQTNKVLEGSVLDSRNVEVRLD